ncbi:MAG: hypothetical protein IIA02_10790 [Proteobacteria bacterium]|nr:hypothetical protein [Pseudomonadota bacterium]
MSLQTLKDHAKDGYDLVKLERLLRDSENQPEWRDRADQAWAYKDGDQMTPEQKHRYRKDKLEPRVINLIGRVVNAVLGTQAKSRRDPRVESDDDSFADVAEVISAQLKEARRETNADMAVSNAYASQVIAGLGWVEVSRNADLLGYRYRVRDVHRSEMWWDWRAKELDLSDARWICRRRWLDLDEVVAKMPEFEEVLRAVVGDWAGVLTDDWQDEVMHRAYNDDRRFGVARSEWVDGGRQRLKLSEVWYKVPIEAVVFRVRGGQWRRLDLSNLRHVEAVNRGLVEIEKTVTFEIRTALFAGPIRLYDRGTKRRRYPYIPFWAFRADVDNAPYGLVDGMIPAQDEYNERRMRIQWMLKAQQLHIDNDALDTNYNTIEDIANEMMRPDMVAVLNSNRRNARGFEMRNDLTLQKEQYEVMQDAKQLIQDVPGVYATQLGNSPTGVTSGLAINSLVEQGIVAMGELNDNTMFGERLVNESLVDLIVEDLDKPDMPVFVGTGGMRREVILNTTDEQGAPINMVAEAPIKVGLSDVPTSAAFRMQQAQQIAGMITALASNPQAVAVLTPAYIESSGLPDRHAVADDLRRVSGLPVAGDRHAAQAWQQQQQQQAAKTAQIQEAAATVELQHKGALAERDAAQARLLNAKADQTGVATQREAASPHPDVQAAINDALAEASGP